MLSRNFRLQKVGDLNWLNDQYDFSHISLFIDELVVLDVSRGERNEVEFCDVLKKLGKSCFIPIAAGGGIRTIDAARNLLRSGADKIVINSPLYGDWSFVSALSAEFGEQCIVASMDVMESSTGDFQVWSHNGEQLQLGLASNWMERFSDRGVGEIYLNSINRDGTGIGCDMRLLHLLPPNFNKPVILVGGVGNSFHLDEALRDSRVDGVATAHLFNFIGDTLQKARKSLLSDGINLANWEITNPSEGLMGGVRD